MGVQSGARDTSYLETNRLKVDMSDVSLLDPDEAPFIVLLTRMAKKAAKSYKFEHIERELAPRWDTADGAFTAGAGTITVDNGSYFTKRDLVEVPRTGEVMLVTDISSNTLTVTRGFGDTSAAAGNDGEDLQIIGNASEQNADRPTLKTYTGSTPYNYTQIFRHAFGASNTEMNSEIYGDTTRSQERYEWGITHARDMERAFLFGTRSKGTGPNGKVRTTTRGLIPWIQQGDSNVKNAGGALTESEWEDYLRRLFKYASSKSRVVLCSDLVLSVISGWARGKLQTKPKDQTYGINITQYISPHGKVNLINHDLLTGDIYGGYAVGVDMSAVSYRPLQNRDTSLRTNIQPDKQDGWEDEYLTEAGLQFMHPNRHAILKNVTG